MDITPKDKALELVNFFKEILSRGFYEDGTELLYDAKQCAIKCIEENLEAYKLANVEYEDGVFTKYFLNVKQEINKL